MNLGYDPKWALVKSLIYFEGLEGATTAADEKTNVVTSLFSCTISRLTPEFPAGALYFQDIAASRWAMAPSSSVLAFGNNVFELSLILLDWGASGLRRIFRGNSVSAYINPATFALVFGVNIDGAGWVNATYVIPDPETFIGTRHDVRFGVTSTEQFIELDGAEVVRVAHGKTTSANALQQIRFGQSVSDGDGWIGYIGPFRWTGGDIRPELSGQPMARFPVLGAVDPLREKVVFHSHFEPAPDGVPADTKGKSIQLLGAQIDQTTRKYGVSSLRLLGPARVAAADGGPAPDLIFGTRDFDIECWAGPTANDSSYENCLISIVSIDGASVLELRVARAIAWNQTRLIVNGISYSASGSFSAFSYVSVVRRGRYISVFVGNARWIFADIGDVALAGNGYIYFGKAPSITGQSATSARIDECRITLDATRRDPESLSAPAPTEFFSEYGPRSLSGTVIDPDGNPLVRTVRAYHRVTGRLISETVSALDGTWSLPVADTGQHFVVIHDDVKNALIFDRVQPVLIT